ncbi:hypothetical protein PF005_g360 [Phytophthora fragariae]|uniref:Uncharacterized protein n=1 Tax=Phytophthora fragariae TaxID=53985 RepID=A0A6A3UZ15_9STRA|nr:hypothetical protein PF003_g9766 [Phytophthora fragariae]KAE8950079.1 hypothetical protein PF009_g400 [Phytophthora fragariae]KAE9022734.1 hypothetical protein PF011_g4305 [Phytophthora fragariae]KAE9139431.1 hypothetical protein PF007_g998 [Phytophthora fragariae]KAE9139990.1 hypothetical protein PF010_g391 [Phytophthora fragariae]
MLTMSDGYWDFVHHKRLYCWLNASLTSFAIIYYMGAGTSYTVNFVVSKYTQSQLDENERLLQWIYVFYPTFAWSLVYFTKFLFKWKIKRLRKARNYKYKLMLTSLVMVIFYVS